ncbi:MAG: InlB B-repeat-containing protein, partial [Clostridia bacterium]|nr:InlB B-repeat-containing protein [Clostridia bacterium]
MRRTKKAISLLLTLAMVLTMIPVITLTFTEKVKAYSSYSQQRSPEYYYASGTQFIYQLVLYYSSSSNGAASDWLSNNGWTDWSGNFNAGDGSSSKYVHSGYKTTTDPTVAIKKVLVADGHPSSLTYGGCTYYAVGGGAITQLPAQGDGCVDLNKGNGGDDLYLMATVDYGAGPALTALTKSQSGNAGTAQNNLTNNGYTIATDQSGNYQDTNAGAGGDYNYVGYKSSCTTVNSSTLRSNYATLLAKYNQISYYNYPSTTKANIESALTTASNILADLNDGYTTSNQTAINNAASACSTQAGYMTVKTPVISRYTWVRDGVAGYYAYAYVDTNGGAPINRVQFPTWTNLNGQDDIQSNWGTNSAASGTSGSWTVNGSTYNYRYYVAVSSHNNEYVGYNTHIYAYNSLGGQTSSGGTFGSFTYPVTYAGGGATGGSTSGQTVNYGEAVNVRTNGFTRAYSVTYDGNGGTAAKTSDTATYTFTGWAGSTSTPGYLINNAGEKSGTGGSSSYTDFAQWGIAAPFLAGEEYTLEFDAYGTGTLINYFYGGSGYLNCAKAVSSNGRTSTGGDGNITASMTSSWTHYKIVWTLGSNGDGNVIKYVLFRASQGTSNVIHAKNIKFYQSKFVNSSKMLNLSTSGTYTMTAQWNSAAVTLPNATRTGYDFNGWYSAASGGTRYGGNGTSYTPTATTAMHAQWTPYTYYVSFNGNGSTSGSMSNQSFTYDTAKALTANGFTRAFTVTYNHLDGRANTTATATATFNGWATSSTGSVAYSNQQSVKNLTSTKNGTFPLYAKWTDGSVTLPTPTRTGYMFGGWYENEGCTGTRYNGGTSYTPSGNKTLYAKWVPNQFNVTFNGNGATSGSMSAQTFTYDVAQNLSANAFSRAYTVTYAGNGGTPSKASDTATATFNGWATSASGAKVYNNQQSVSNLAASGTFPLYANWTLASVTLPSATRSGYQFTGWKASDNGTVYNAGVNYTPTANVTMTAQWSENSYQFRFNGNGATSGTMANQTYTFSESKALSANQFQRKYTVTLKYNDGGDDGHPVATYAFAGWTVNQNGSGTVYADQQVISGFSAVNNNVIDLYAQWTPASVTLPTPYWNAYTFNGWYTDSECTEANKVNGTTFTPTADITLYAKRTANNYTITFDAADGEAVSALGYKTTDTTGLPSTEKAGYRFAGWKVTTADGNWTAGSVVTAGTSVKNKYGSPTLTAQWTPVEYTMILNVDGVQTVDTYTIESEATLPEESKTGYTFQGWKVTANEGNWTETSNLAAGTALAGRYGNVTLAAQWEAETYEISYEIGDGATTAGAPLAVQYDGSYTFTVTLDAAHNQTTPTVTATNATVSQTREGDVVTVTLTDVTGAVEVDVPLTINTYTLTIIGDEGFTCDDTANTTEYGQTLTFTVKLSEGYTQTAPVVTKDGTTLNPTAVNGTDYTYQIADITADVTVSVTAAKNTYAVSVTADDGATVTTDASPVTHGENFSFSVTPKTGYTQTAPAVTVNNETLAAASVVDGTYNYVIAEVKETKAVAIATTINTYAVTFTSDDGADAPAAQTITHGQDCEFTVTLNEGYTQTAPVVTVGSETLEALDNEGNVYTYKIAGVTADKAVAIATAINTYDVTFTSDDGADAPAAQTVDHGATCTFTVTLKTGYTQTAPVVTVDGAALTGTTEDDLTFTYVIEDVTADKAVAITTTLNSYDVTFTSDDGADAPEAQTVDHGEDCTFTVTLNTGYTQTAPVVTVDGATLTYTEKDGDVYTYKITDVTADKAVAIATAINTYDVTFTSDDGAAAPVGQTITHGQDCTFTVVLKTGYTQNAPAVTVDGETLTYTEKDGDVYTYKITGVTADKAVAIATTLNSYAVTFTSDDGADAPEAQTVDHGADASFTVTLKEGYTQTAPVVTVDGVDLEADSAEDNTYSYVIANVTGDKEVAIATAINSYDVTFTADDGADAPAAQAIDHGENCTFTVTLKTGYTQTAPVVTVGSETLAGTTEDDLTFTYVIEDVTADKAVTITTTLNSYDVTFTSDDGADAPAAQTVNHGEDCTFSVTLNEGYTQTAPVVTVDGATLTGTTEDDLTFTYVIEDVTADKAVTIATAINTYDVTFTSDDGADAPAAQTVDHGEDCTFTVTLNTGYTQTAPAVTVDGAAL